ncbi:unnamed protein product [Cylindrotheca closterium]|uniref:Uncharacterized protein n=1 Tax=Cylindrotheca closterium TaxID=2856 RepID=A0AAD2FQ57_9STRA|nr:unnamed protein product [Cylindrotheca closterium]
MVFSKKSVTGLVVGLSLATDLSYGFVVVPKHNAGLQATTSTSSTSHKSSPADGEWFYEEKKTLYSEEETERGKRQYTKLKGGKTQVFHDNYPLSPNKPAPKPSPYKPVAMTTDNRWFAQESTLSYDSTLRQRIAPPTAKTRSNDDGEQGMVVPMPEGESTEATAKSPYQPAGHTTTKTAVSTIPVANTVVSPSKPIAVPVALRPEDVITPDGRWFNNESMVSYGSRARNRHYQNIKAEHKAEQAATSPFVPVSVADTTKTAKRSSIDVTTTLPLKTRKEGDVVVKPDEKATTIAAMAGNAIGDMIAGNKATSAEDAKEEEAPTAAKQEETPEQVAARMAAIAASTVTTENRWFNTEKRDFFRPAQKHTPYTIRNPEYHASPNMMDPDEELASASVSTGAYVYVGYNSTSAAAPKVATDFVPLTSTTDQKWFNAESKGTYSSGALDTRQHKPYMIRNPEYHRSPSMMDVDEELSSASAAATGAYVRVSYNPTSALAAPIAASKESTETVEPSAPESVAPPVPRVATELIPLTATTDQKWFNEESKGTYFSGARNVRQHKPYTIRNPEMHRSPNMMRAEREASAGSPSAGAYVSVSYNSPAQTAEAPKTTSTTENKSETLDADAAGTADTVQKPSPAEVLATEELPESTVSTDNKWFNAESMGAYDPKNVRKHTPYQLIPKGLDEASIRTSAD